MARARIYREFPTALLENPLSFSLLLHRRLETLNIFSQRSVQFRIRAFNQELMSEEGKLREFNRGTNK